MVQFQCLINFVSSSTELMDKQCAKAASDEDVQCSTVSDKDI